MVDVLPQIALIAKFPTPGRAKTRLVPALGEEGAAQVHRRLVERTMVTIRTSGLPFSVWTTGASHAEFADWLGDDIRFVEQGEGDLGARLARVPAPGIVLGGDIPGLTVQHLRDAAAGLAQVPAVIGPASDGGYYLLGFQHQMPFLWRDMPWGTETVRERTEMLLREQKIAYRLLDELDDCDRPEDLVKWPDLLE
ncbi:hypothetical protein AAV99_02045 [Aurantiacibacter marinus]|uniref:Glycosyltransferase n=2 Tax=Aurantiacibacter marinus TaxID=874156 RepID=A0A0H0XQ09_9SPHN|nr:hypothetical protein AAV99_02045 [Aurantiacibacter marinus]